MSESDFIIKKATAVQASKIVQPVLENLRVHGLERIVTFVYQEAIMDVDILSPSLEIGMKDKERDLEQVAFLLKKHGIAVPKDIQLHQKEVQKKNGLRISIKHFENWLMEHLLYSDFEGFTINTIYYSPRIGFLVKFNGLEPIPDSTHESPINIIQNEGIVKKKLDKEPVILKTSNLLKKEKLAHKEPLEEWKKKNLGFLWVKKQLALGRPRKEIIYEFNEVHKKNPENYSSREGKELSAAILSHWSKIV